MTIGKRLSLCILNCYPKHSRDNFDKCDIGHPHEFFKNFLARYAPNAVADVLFIADMGTALPKGAALTSYDGYLWTGSDLTVYHHDDARVTRQIEFTRALFSAGVPSYGSCWGVQMAAVAAGGEVRKNPKGREWGIARAITRTETGRRSGLLAGKPDRFDAFIMHLDEVTRLPTGVTMLATNEHSRVQAVEIQHGKGVFWSAQYHPEYNLYEMARLIAGRAEVLVKEGFFRTTDEVRAYADKMKALHRDPSSTELRQELAVGDDILDTEIREQELRNWIDFLASKTE